MSEIRKIWANARYEMITLLRGWFFRIFAALLILIFIWANIILFGETSWTPRLFKGFSTSVPYANMIFLIMIQIVIIVFLSSDFFKRDRRLNTAEVFYIRSMSNATYLFGKAFGIFFILTILNLVTESY